MKSWDTGGKRDCRFVRFVMYMSDAISWRERACTSEPQMPLVSDGVLEQAVITVSALFVENVMKKFKSHPGVSVEESACQCRRHEFSPWVWKSPWRRKRHSTPVFLPGKSHGQRSYSTWGHKRVGRDLVTEHVTESVSNRCLPNKVCDYMDVSLPDVIVYHVMYAITTGRS